jgi:hypothetical protein
MSGEIETLHRPFARYLREQGLYFITSRCDEPSTIREGHADFTILRNGHALLIEFKRAKEGRLSKAQKECIAELEATGTTVHVIRDLQTAIDLVTAWHSTLKEPPATPEKRYPIHRYNGKTFEERDGILHEIRDVGILRQ